MSDPKKPTMTPEQIHADIVSEFRRMGFARHSESAAPSGLKACAEILKKCETDEGKADEHD